MALNIQKILQISWFYPNIDLRKISQAGIGFVMAQLNPTYNQKQKLDLLEILN